MWRATVDRLLQDARYGWRQLRRNPTFTAAAVLSLALGIGAGVTMFSAFRAVFLRALPYRDADRIVELRKAGAHDRDVGTTLADAQFLRDYAHSFEKVAHFSDFKSLTLSGTDDPANLWVRYVSPNLFSLLGSAPLLGRVVAAADFGSRSPQIAVLSYDTWRKYFHQDGAIVGRQMFLNRENYVVVGVMPQGFDFPQHGIAAWLPDRTPVTNPLHTSVGIVARLRPDITVGRAREELKSLTPTLKRLYPASEKNWNFSIEGLAGRDVQSYRKAFSLLMAAVGFLMLIACLNVANLLLARASGRETEFALRAALGAGRRRIAGQVLTESVVLAGLGGSLGLALAYAGNLLLVGLLPARLLVPRLDETHLDFQVLGFAVVITLATGILFGLLPAMKLSQRHVGQIEGRTTNRRAISFRYQSLLIGEVALSFLLLSGAVLMIRSFTQILDTDPGFRTAHVLTATVPPARGAHLSDEQQKQRYGQILQLAQDVPGVKTAALTTALPMGSIEISVDLYLAKRSREPFRVQYHAVSSGYFGAMGIPLKGGRLFNRSDSEHDTKSILIDEEMARRFWPGVNPVGEHVSMQSANGVPDLTVIGVVGNTRYRDLTGAPIPEMYRPYQQHLGPAVGATFVLRTLGNPVAAASSLRKAVHQFDPEQVIENVKTMDTIVDESIAEPRFYTALLIAFGVLALLLTLVGVYGVASYGVSRRTREMGIRMALGAERRQLVMAIIRQGLASVLAGLALGLLAAWMLARFMAGMVYGVPVQDPISLAIAVVVLLLGATFAYYGPARRATQADPAEVLRYE